VTGYEIIQKRETTNITTMAFAMNLTRGLLISRLKSRFVPAFLVCVLASIPLSSVHAEPDNVPVARNDFSRAAHENTFASVIEAADIEVAETEEPSPATEQFLMTVQLAQALDDQNDPLEGFNRTMFAFNEVFYDVVMRPVSGVYEFVPANIRMMIGSFLANLSAPVVFVNDVLQGEFERALTTAGRFVVNSSFGFAGVADVASSMGLEEHDEDFGQTLATWGVGEGFYLVLPVLGPGNPRDAVGRFVVDPWIDPVNYRLDETGNEDWIYGRFALAAVDQFSSVKDELDQLKKTSIDYYAAVRSLYRQKRKAEIANGDELDLPAIPDFEFSDFPEYDEPEPAIGGSGDSARDDDQISTREFEREVDEKIIANPFETHFVPAVSAREIADRNDLYRPAPRKPDAINWVDTAARDTGNDSSQVATLSWNAVTYPTNLVSR